jgi:hypothetical protein
MDNQRKMMDLFLDKILLSSVFEKVVAGGWVGLFEQ